MERFRKKNKMKKLLLLLLCVPLIVSCQETNEKTEPEVEKSKEKTDEKITDYSKHAYNLLINKDTALKYKDSLVNIGWTYQEKFPFFL